MQILHKYSNFRKKRHYSYVLLKAILGKCCLNSAILEKTSLFIRRIKGNFRRILPKFSNFWKTITIYMLYYKQVIFIHTLPKLNSIRKNCHHPYVVFRLRRIKFKIKAVVVDLNLMRLGACYGRESNPFTTQIRWSRSWLITLICCWSHCSCWSDLSVYMCCRSAHYHTSKENLLIICLQK